MVVAEEQPHDHRYICRHIEIMGCWAGKRPGECPGEKTGLCTGLPPDWPEDGTS